MTSETIPDSKINKLLEVAPYALLPEEKNKLFLEAMQAAYRHHFSQCEAYRRYCSRRDCNETTVFSDIFQIPFLPVQAFKSHSDQLVSTPPEEPLTKVQSSATMGEPSTVCLDAQTSARQLKALQNVLRSVIGNRELPFLVLDLVPGFDPYSPWAARATAALAFTRSASQLEYFMEERVKGYLSFNQKSFIKCTEKFSSAGESVIVFGFTYVLYKHAVLPLLKSDCKLQLPPGSKILHIGGWKKLEAEKVEKEKFAADISTLFGISPSDVVDFYGFSEQGGIVYPDFEDSLKCTPAFSEVIVRDPDTYAPVPDGTPGLLQFLTPLTSSYPGISILTDDVGVIHQRNVSKNGINGTRFELLGRALGSEIRGCGDIMEEKILAIRGSSGAQAPGSADATTSRIAILSNHEPEEDYGEEDDKVIPELVERLRLHQSVLQEYSVNELITLVSAAAERWKDHPALNGKLDSLSVRFLEQWCSRESLQRTLETSLRFPIDVLDGFVPQSSVPERSLRAQPYGLIAHWLAGNIPILGMLSVLPALLTKNVSIVKVSHSYTSILPMLLESFAEVEVRGADGKILKGRDLSEAIAVVYFPPDHQEAATALSSAADVRVAWGGREAVESIVSLPKKYSTEDIVFGPRISYIAIGRDALSSVQAAQELARKASIDIALFDQSACSSPHTIFVEEGSLACPPEKFAELLASEMERTLGSIPKAPIDGQTAGAISFARLPYEFSGKLWTSKGTEWTVLFDNHGAEGLAEVVQSRVITVRGIPDIATAARFSSPDVQTIGLAIPEPQRAQFAQTAAALGVDRFPAVGSMTLFDAPWDGRFAADRFVRWVSLDN